MYCIIVVIGRPGGATEGSVSAAARGRRGHLRVTSAWVPAAGAYKAAAARVRRARYRYRLHLRAPGSLQPTGTAAGSKQDSVVGGGAAGSQVARSRPPSHRRCRVLHRRPDGHAQWHATASTRSIPSVASPVAVWSESQCGLCSV